MYGENIFAKTLREHQQKEENTEKTFATMIGSTLKQPSSKITDLTKRQKFNPDQIKINWITDKGWWELADGFEDKNGYYDFNENTLEIMTDISQKHHRTSNLMITKCKVSPASLTTLLKERENKHRDIPTRKIQIVKGNVQDIMQGVLTFSKKDRHMVFVLPSQLNGAEYLTQKKDDIVTKLYRYKYDYTGGPRGQLGADPGVAQFIIDNAYNENTLDKAVGINNIRLMGEIDGISLLNGYLQIKDDADIEKFKQMLPEMTVMGVTDVPVRGLDEKYKFIGEKDYTVDLIYASAVPVGGTYGNSTSNTVIAIANLTIFAQYVGAMKLAIIRGGKCDLYLMPLGGKAFNNGFENIKNAIINAYNFMERDLNYADINVKIIVWDGSPAEMAAFGV